MLLPGSIHTCWAPQRQLLHSNPDGQSQCGLCACTTARSDPQVLQCVNTQVRSRLLSLISVSPELAFLAKSKNCSARKSTAQPQSGAQPGAGDGKRL